MLSFSAQYACAEKITLFDQTWLGSKEKRAMLGFITTCALKKNQVLASKDGDVKIEYFGKLGIAPRWNGTPNSLTESEQRWVSACVLARVNYFGTPIPFNLRTDDKSEISTPVSEQDLEDYPFFEGEFFGNIFTQPQKKYVCQGDVPKTVLTGKNRICSLQGLDGKKNTSACGFVIVGRCDNPGVFYRDNTHYTERFQVWLKMH
jgi:hypothetical protein